MRIDLEFVVMLVVIVDEGIFDVVFWWFCIMFLVVS